MRDSDDFAVGICTLIAMGMLYLLAWLLLGMQDYFSIGRRCDIGRNPVTGLCVDPHPSSCSAWSPPGFCWRRHPPQPAKP